MKGFMYVAAVATALVLNVSQAEATSSSKIATCSAVSSIAKTVMTKRQQGVLMADLLAGVHRISDKLGGPSDPYVVMANNLIEMAYQKSRYDTPEVQNKVIIDFANENMALCMQTL